MKTIVAKLGNMRKAVEWVVYPKGSDSNDVVIQSDSRIASFDPTTGKGLLSKGVKGAAFLHLLPALGATPVQVPPEVIQAATGAVPKSGDEIGPGIYVA